MEKRDLHIHTTFSDGENTPEEMVNAAIAAGLDTIGFSDHSYTYFDESYCMPLSRYGEYRSEIARLRDKYRRRITILCGIEQDFWSDAPTDGFDHIIGSVHYLKLGSLFIPVDESADILLNAANEYFGGDIYKLTSLYYETVAETTVKTGADIIGHFDIISKFNDGGKLFDEKSPRYVSAWQSAADRLLRCGIPFEINFGAVTRGYKSSPYPSDEIRSYIIKNGGSLILSGDSHSASFVAPWLNDADNLFNSERVKK